ncbi:M35 family metallo-endopeptidase [Melittangium boletus]|uniref:Protease n=1 Tax=Melittangium boletus DSM 14713 TaxID=1294270 RepID=A0A250IQG9_9BACT|nr:M35 family metallo-endopeptidase [Melittangium boletus]ATB33411.1 protease [Melittangium boletus DSM 14713]
MGQNARGFQWLVRGIVGLSLLSACGAPQEGEESALETDGRAMGDVAVELSVANHSLSAREDAVIQVTFTNVSAQPVRLLKWYVPGTEGVKAELFDVSRDGEPVEYLGPHAKRRAPRTEDFVTLAPGERLSGLAPLSNLYDLSETGEYTVRFSAHATGPHPTVLTRAAQLDSNPLGLWIEGRAAHDPERQTQDTVTALGLSFTGCSSTRQTQIRSAWTAAKNYASTAVSYLNGISSGTTRYTTWFGAYSTTHRNTARSHFTKINSALSTALLTVDCTCTDTGTYAYVYPSSPYRIYVCGAFWSASPAGTDSQAGTLVHEVSHFNVVASTNDHAYGQGNAKSLARSNPSRALNNADNHEYFAENTPSQN